jgi:cyclopropane-fatty-acyl-phospholipid synthase
MLATRDSKTWITKYIFPGGFLPSVRALNEAAREHTSLRLESARAIGPHYAETLRRWDEAFRAAEPELERLGFDAVFRRMWHFYLEYSRAGFMSGYIDDHHLVFTRS